MLIVVRELLLCRLLGLLVRAPASVPDDEPAPRSPPDDLPPAAASRLEDRCWPLRRPLPLPDAAAAALAASESEDELERLRAVVELRRLDARWRLAAPPIMLDCVSRE